MSTSSNLKSKKGFTLMESVIAIGIVAVLLTTFLAIFGPATQGIRRAISAQEADRLASTLERELSILREVESFGNPDTAFEKAYDWINASSSDDSNRIFLYNYKGDPSQQVSSSDDGRMKPVREGSDEGGDYVLTPAVRIVNGGILPPEMTAELEVAVGPVYYVRTRQLIFDQNGGGGLVLGGAGVVPPRGQQDQPLDGGTGADSYPDAVIAFSAEFHALRSNALDYLNNFETEDLGRPLFRRNMAIRR